jgi:putative ABC transport system substrate-binding protein
MFSKGTIAVFSIILFLALFFSINAVKKYKKDIKAQSQELIYTIGVLKTIDHPALNETTDGVIKILKSELSNVKIISESAQGDMALAQQIVQKFSQQKVDAIITIGTMVTQTAMRQTKTIPIIFGSVTDPVGSGIVSNPKLPEKNITGVSNFNSNITYQQLSFFKKLMPKLKKLGIVYSAGESNSVVLVSKVKEEAKKFGISIKETIAQNTNDAVFVSKSLLSNVDAIFIDNDNTALGAIKGIVDVAMKNSIPVFCSDIDSVHLGVLAAVGPEQYKLGEEVGKMAIDIVKNKKEIKDIPVKYSIDTTYLVNRNTAKKLKITIPNDEFIKILE